MPAPARKRETGRGERVLPGIFRLRLPLPWPGVPHGNAWALRAGDGIVLVDTGVHEPGSIENLELAMGMVGLRVEDVRLLVCTHAHSDHYGQAATIIERAGCELWMHPDHEHLTAAITDPEAALEHRLEIARSAGIPEEQLARLVKARRDAPLGVAAIVEPDRHLLDGMTVTTDHGEWTVVETPGHAPSHVCLWQPGQRVLISGDHLLGRVSIYFDPGSRPDPVRDFLTSLDRVEALNARLCLSGHGRTFSDVQAHIDANREVVGERLRALEAVLADGPLTAFEALMRLREGRVPSVMVGWLVSETLCYLRHLRAQGLVTSDGADPERWTGS
jgi:glyoxylase-like metal-dependent hydrolase (beta-lactamase superfamily II)